MNIHPLFVHFPIALFLLYSLFEILRFNKIKNQPYWFYVKAILVIFGALAAWVTVFTGGMAEEIYRGLPKAVVETHSTVAMFTTILYTIIALTYVIGWMRRRDFVPFKNSPFLTKMWAYKLRFELLVTEKWLGVILALIGAGLISLTGALGGLLVYGPQNDPMSAFLYNLIVK
jgi:uncharacterized membrane protein